VHNLDGPTLKPEENQEKVKKNKPQSAKKKVKIDLIGNEEPDNVEDILEVIDKHTPPKKLTADNMKYTKKTSIENTLMKKVSIEKPKINITLTDLDPFDFKNHMLKNADFDVKLKKSKKESKSLDKKSKL